MWWGRADLVEGRLAEPELVEGPDGEGVEQPAGRGDRDPGQGAGDEGPGPVRVGPESGREVLELGVVAAGEHRPSEPAAGGLAVDPGHRVAVGPVAGLHLVHHVVEVGRPFGVDQHVAGLDGEHLEGGVGDHPGEPHAPGRGPEQVGIGLRCDLHRAGRGDQGHLEDVGAEATVDVVVLPVDVGGDGTADGDQSGARADRHEPPEWDEAHHERLEAHPRTAHGDHAGLEVHLVEARPTRWRRARCRRRSGRRRRSCARARGPRCPVRRSAASATGAGHGLVDGVGSRRRGPPRRRSGAVRPHPARRVRRPAGAVHHP